MLSIQTTILLTLVYIWKHTTNSTGHCMLNIIQYPSLHRQQH